MKTNQIIETVDRELAGVIVRQRTCDSFYSLRSILFLIDKWRYDNGFNKAFDFMHYIRTQNVSEFLQELESQTGLKPYIPASKKSEGWVHPFFALKILIHNNPKFEIEVYRWMFDNLIENRIKGGDSYTRMSGILFKYAINKAAFPKNIKLIARKIKDMLCVDDWNKATKEQLEKRDYIHNMIADLAHTLRDSGQGVRLGLSAYLAKYKG